MKTLIRILPLFLVLTFGISSCGYRNPYIYTGPSKTIYITKWKNRTSELQLNNAIYKSLLEWYQKAGSFKITRKKEGADFILAGEIHEIKLPSLTFNADNDASKVKVELTVRYILKDLTQDKVLFEQSKTTLTEDYDVSTSSAVTADNEQEALDEIIDTMSETIYLKTLKKLMRMQALTQ